MMLSYTPGDERKISTPGKVASEANAGVLALCHGGVNVCSVNAVSAEPLPHEADTHSEGPVECA